VLSGGLATETGTVVFGAALLRIWLCEHCKWAMEQDALPFLTE